MRTEEEVRVEYRMEDVLTAPVAEGTPVGSIDYIVGDTVYKQEIIVTGSGLDAIDLEWCVGEILKRFVLP